MAIKFYDYYQLCKPKVLFLMITTSWAGMVLSQEPLPSVLAFTGISLGIFFIAAFGAVLNQFFEDYIDAKMGRTSQRPLVKKSLSRFNVSIFAATLVILGSALLVFFANKLTLLLTLGGALGYACVYTLFLKHHTSQNIVIGGLYGALPPLLGWTSLTNSIDPQALLLPLIIFVWTPPHFWALAINRVHEYEQAQLPMLPVTHGVQFTSYFILLYNVLLFLACFLPFLVGMFSPVYAIASIVLNSIYFVYNVNVLNGCTHAAMKSFKFSIAYLYLLFLAMVFDRVVTVL